MISNASTSFKMLGSNTILEYYRTEMMNGGMQENIKFKEVVEQNSKNSALEISNDPIHVQLLVETALSDSKDFEVLSQELVEEIKKECGTLINQIEHTRQTLTLKCKYHETSLSITRLSGANSLEEKALKFPEESHVTQINEDNQELAEIQRECEELAVKLSHLEKQLMISQNRLQRHTAGILHLKLNQVQDLGETNGSSDNIYTFKPKNKGSETIREDFLFDERSLYSELEITSGNNNDTSVTLRDQIGKICTTEKKLVELNHRLRKIISIMDLKNESKLSPPPESSSNSESFDMLETHLDFMEQSIAVVEREQGIVNNRHKLVISQVDELLQQKNILQRQIQLQREQNSIADVKKDSEIQQKNKELAQISALQAETENEACSLRKQLDNFQVKFDQATQTETFLNTAIKEKDIILAQKEKKIDELHMDLARLQTEASLAKAELEAAYGSRAERAAQAAVNPAIQKELERLLSEKSSLTSEIAALKSQAAEVVTLNNDEIAKELKKELAELVGEYELMTIASIEWEKERGQLEKTIDNLRDAKEQIESQLYEEKIRWMGLQDFSAGAISPDGRTTSTTILKNEFKKMTRDIRAEHMKLLKAERAECRRLEVELRNLKKPRSS